MYCIFRIVLCFVGVRIWINLPGLLLVGAAQLIVMRDEAHIRRIDKGPYSPQPANPATMLCPPNYELVSQRPYPWPTMRTIPYHVKVILTAKGIPLYPLPLLLLFPRRVRSRWWPPPNPSPAPPYLLLKNSFNNKIVLFLSFLKSGFGEFILLPPTPPSLP